MSVRHLIPETAGLINAARSVAPIVAVVSEDKPRDGVTTVSCNLAAELVGMRRSVAVVDCDFADPQLHDRLDQPLGEGLAAVLAGDMQIEQVFDYRSTSGGKFLAVTAGEQHVRQALRLTTPMAVRAVQRLCELADIVLLNSAPLTTQVGRNLVTLADSVVLVGSVPPPLGPEKRPALLPGSSPYVAARVADPDMRSRPRVRTPKQPDQTRQRFDVPAPRSVGRRPLHAAYQSTAVGSERAPVSERHVEAAPSRRAGPRRLPTAPEAFSENAGLRGPVNPRPALASDWDDAPRPRKRRFYRSAQSRYLD